MRYLFQPSAVDYAFLVFDTHTGHHVGGTAFHHSDWSYQHSRWNGKTQVHDTVRADGPIGLSEKIDKLLNG